MSNQPLATKVAYAITEIFELADGDKARLINPANEIFFDSAEANRAAAQMEEELGPDKVVRAQKVRLL